MENILCSPLIFHQYLHDSSCNSFQIKLIKIEYKKHIEVVHIKNHQDYNGNKIRKNYG